MADKKGGGMELGKLIAPLAILGAAWWIGVVMQAEGEEKYVKACKPVSVATGYLIKVTTGLTGFTPRWTLKAKEVVDGGCYYFFATFLFSDDFTTSVDEGLQQRAVKDGDELSKSRSLVVPLSGDNGGDGGGAVTNGSSGFMGGAEAAHVR